MTLTLTDTTAPDLTQAEREAMMAGFKILADDTRLRLLKLLSQGERCVCHLVDLTGLPQGTVSHHLGILRRAGWVRDRRDMNDYRWTYYSLNTEHIQELQASLGRLLDPQVTAQPAPPCPEE